MSNPHLLGPDWEFFRWYETATDRDAAFSDMTARHPYYRLGDHPTQVLTKVQR